MMQQHYDYHFLCSLIFMREQMQFHHLHQVLAMEIECSNFTENLTSFE